VTQLIEMAAGARGTPRNEAFVHAVLAPGMPLEWIGSRTHELSFRSPARTRVERGALRA
jgi:hypothetical protein